MRVGAEARCVWYGRSRAGRAHAGKEPPGGGSLPDGVREGALPGVHTPALLTGPVCRADRPWTSLASTGLAPCAPPLPGSLWVLLDDAPPGHWAAVWQVWCGRPRAP